MDNIRTHKPDPEKPPYNVYFELSMVPPGEWKQIFEEQQPTKQSTSPPAWIDGRHVVVQCLFNEIEKKLRDIRHEVAKTNHKYRQYLHKQSIK